VGPRPYLTSKGSEEPQDYTDDGKDAAQGVQDADVEQSAQQNQNHTKNDHEVSFLLDRCSDGYPTLRPPKPGQMPPPNGRRHPLTLRGQLLDVPGYQRVVEEVSNVPRRTLWNAVVKTMSHPILTYSKLEPMAGNT